MNRMPGEPGGSGQQQGGSPVPEWFGRDERAPAALRSGGSLGCVTLLFGLAIAAVGLFYGWSADARAKQLANERNRCELAQTRDRESLRECQALQSELKAKPCPTPSATATATATTTATEPAQTEPVVGSLAPNDIAKVTRTLNPAFRRCYDQAVAENPTAEARIQLALTIDPSGKVTDARASGPVGPTGLPQYTYRCFESVAKGARFPEATEKTSVNLPMTFSR